MLLNSDVKAESESANPEKFGPAIRDRNRTK